MEEWAGGSGESVLNFVKLKTEISCRRFLLDIEHLKDTVYVSSLNGSKSYKLSASQSIF